MHQFFVEKSQVGKEYVTITGSDVNHIRNVLRMKIGETIRISSCAPNALRGGSFRAFPGSSSRPGTLTFACARSRELWATG